MVEATGSKEGVAHGRGKGETCLKIPSGPLFFPSEMLVLYAAK